MRGLAHVGALRAVREAGLDPSEIIGASIGALIGAAWAAGHPIEEIEQLALGMTRKDVFRIAHRDMAFKRMQSPALYRSEPLELLISGLVGQVTFDELPRRLIVSTVDINSGMQVCWGLPGLTDVKVADAVYASCALPGFLPPLEIRGRHYVDGAVVDNLPVHLAASRGADAVIAVDVGASSVLREDTQEEGFAAVYARAAEIVFRQLLETSLRGWASPPLLLIQPRVEHVPMFAFDATRELVDEGYRATRAALDAAGDAIRSARPGIFPRRRVEIRVNRERCIGCGACLVHGPPGMFVLDAAGKAVTLAESYEFSPVDGGFIRHCPTYAITARRAGRPGPEADAATVGGSTGTGRVSA